MKGLLYRQQPEQGMNHIVALNNAHCSNLSILANMTILARRITWYSGNSSWLVERYRKKRCDLVRIMSKTKMHFEGSVFMMFAVSK
jgi:hypothetical protein